MLFGFNGGLISSNFQDNLIRFYNPSYTHKVWRSGDSYTGVISAPKSFSIYWEFIDFDTREVVASGDTKEVTHTFNFVTMLDSNVYDLRVVITNGINEFEKIFVGEVVCLPQVPTTFDLQINSATFSSVSWTSRPGYAIRVHGNIGSGTVDLRKYKSDDPTQPIHIVLDNCSISSTTWNFKVQMLKNVIIDGCTDERIPYGCRMYKSDSGVNQHFVFDWNGSGSEIDYFSSNVIICGLYGNGRLVAGNGNTFLRILPGGRDATVNNFTRQFTGLTIFNTYSQDCHEENIYLGYFGDSPSGGYSHSIISGAKIFRNKSYNAGLDVFQITAHNSKVFDNHFKNGGYRGDINHENCVQIGSSYNVHFFKNKIEQHAAHNLMFLANGYYGGFCEVHSNIFISSVGRGDAGNIWSRADLSSGFTTIAQRVYNNTIYCNEFDIFRLYEATATDFRKFFSWNNLMMAENLDNYDNGSAVNSANVAFDNWKVLNSNLSTVKLKNTTAFNFNVNNLSSPIYRVQTGITATSIYQDYDYKGYKIIDPVDGAYSGYELFVDDINNSLKIDTNNITISGFTLTLPINSVGNIAIKNNNISAGVSIYSNTDAINIPITASTTSNKNLILYLSGGSYTTANTITISVGDNSKGIVYDLSSNRKLSAYDYENIAIELPDVGFTPLELNINFFTGTASGWVPTGSLSPYPGSATDRDYGVIGEGIGLKSINTGGYLWNGTGSNGASTGANTGVFPDAVLTTYWLVAANQTGRTQLYNVPSGEYTIQVTASRGSIANDRTTRFRVNGGVSQNVNARNNTSASVTFTNVVPVAGIINIDVDGVIPQDSDFGYLNGLKLVRTG